MARVGLADIQYIEALRDQGFDEDAIVARTRWSRPVVREIMEGKHSLQLQYNHMKDGFTIEEGEPLPPWLAEKIGVSTAAVPITMHNTDGVGTGAYAVTLGQELVAAYKASNAYIRELMAEITKTLDNIDAALDESERLLKAADEIKHLSNEPKQDKPKENHQQRRSKRPRKKR